MTMIDWLFGMSAGLDLCGPWNHVLSAMVAGEQYSNHEFEKLPQNGKRR